MKQFDWCSQEYQKSIVRAIQRLNWEVNYTYNLLNVGLNTFLCPKPRLGYYRTIVIDPPWTVNGNVFGRSRPAYLAMTYEQIVDLHIEQYADKNCHLYIWAINRLISLPELIAKEWGFRYLTAITWDKKSIGMGNYFRNSTEHLMFCVKGKLPILRKNAPTLISAKRGSGGHSSKPDKAYKFIESCSPGPYLDYFGRTKRPGWDVYGQDGLL